jgi:hypothetical protein
MARALDASGRPQEAVPFYQKALMLAQTVEPRFQQAPTMGNGTADSLSVRSSGCPLTSARR